MHRQRCFRRLAASSSTSATSSLFGCSTNRTPSAFSRERSTSIQTKRRHFHNTKRSFASQVSMNDTATQDVLLDDSKESRVKELGDAIKEIELRGNYFGQFSLTVVIYDLEMAKVDRACADFYKVFSVHDAQLYEEKYNLLNAFLAAVPGNHVFNLRYMYLLNTNYADFSFLFTLHGGE